MFIISDIPTSISEVDNNNNNNNSKNLDIEEFDYDIQMNIYDLSHIILAEQLTIIDAVCSEVFQSKIIFQFYCIGIIKTCFTL